MIEKEKLSLEDAILLLKQSGYCKELKCFNDYAFSESLLSDRFQKMIFDENEKKKEEKNEKRLIDLCECFALLFEEPVSEELLFIIMPCLLKVASKKEENEEIQKEAEMALLALSNVYTYYEIRRKLYLNEIKAIIRYHQEHHNLTRLAFQSAWQFLINRFFTNISLEEVIMNELHFSKEAARELEDLSKSVDWKRKEEGKGENEAKEVLVIERWLNVIDFYFDSCRSWNRELVGLFCSIVQVFQASRDNYPYTSSQCLCSLRRAAEKRNVEIDGLLKSGAIGAVVEEIQQPTINDDIMWNGLLFFLSISERLKEKTDGETTETKRKELKRKIFEKMEEDGYEDVIAGFHKVFDFLRIQYHYKLSLDFSDYIVNI
eukprot:MONOS_4409.1-p1 / transcript=MONOS_4409.1 / gene=MONOS_4409 / organism=Monocercomonoides_exilis_PA203 / gene_product=unspecified product / transcript_product=unspecified product / location=Mono_scaffold00117:45117-46303(-) / protein_length=375 / sequence_SO=supercontig / SO=protein_coding / is_pseudo=false